MTGMKPDDLPFDLLRSDPHRYLELAHEIVRQNPTRPHRVFRRQQATSELGHHELALADVDTAIALSEPHILLHNLRGLVLRNLNRHQEAVEEFGRGRELDARKLGSHLRAFIPGTFPCSLGNLDEALADCAALPEDHWTPGLFGAPAGTKQEVTEQSAAWPTKRGDDEKGRSRQRTAEEGRNACRFPAEAGVTVTFLRVLADAPRAT